MPYFAKKLVRTALVVASVLSLTACGYIQKEMSSEEMMLDKAEFATGITAKNLKIVPDSVRAEIVSVHYKVKVRNGKVFRCYFTSAIAVTSDAICTPIDATVDVLSVVNCGENVNTTSQKHSP